jgi:uncharacterized protein YjaG (DUF416 family)
MHYEDFTIQFNQQVLELDQNRQLDLAVTICKKLFFDYQMFSEKYQWGNPDILLDAITICEQGKHNKVDNSLVEQMIAYVDSITPDIDDFGDWDGSYALNACVAVCETLEFLIDTQPKHIYYVGICLTDTVDFKIQEEKEFSKVEIDKHPMMIEARGYLLDNSK